MLEDRESFPPRSVGDATGEGLAVSFRNLHRFPEGVQQSRDPSRPGLMRWPESRTESEFGEESRH